MKQNIRITSVILIFLLLAIQDGIGQSFQDRGEIIKEYGTNFTTGTSSDGVKYLQYVTPTNSEASGTFDLVQFFYFTNLPNGKEGCYMWKIIVPSSEVNHWVSTLKHKYVEVNDMAWKDYKTNMLYVITLQEPYCMIQAHYDFKKID